MNDPKDVLKDVHKRMVSEFLGRNQGNERKLRQVEIVINQDQSLRKAVADLYLSLNELNDPRIAVEILAEHVAILVDMINQFKGQS